MKTRVTAWLAAVAVAAGTLAGLSRPAVAGDDQTEDVLYMHDGRELHGQIVSETEQFVVFRMAQGTITSTMTIPRNQVATIKHDVPVEGRPAAGSPPGAPRAPSAAPAKDPGSEPRFGRTQAGDDAPAFYVVPMKGQLGTDIHPSVYKKVVQDIRARDPDMVVVVMDCKNKDDLMIPLNEATEQGLFMHHEYREIVNLFRDEIRDIPQVMWVEDSHGFSSLLAMAWPDMYMARSARLGGLREVSKRAEGWSDEDVAAKMMAAWTGIGRGFLENGGHARELAEAMMQPKFTLSASFKGREVVWLLNDQGEFLVDREAEKTAEFDAKLAEDLLISQGTADSLDDLAFLLGYREYRVVEGDGEKLVEGYKDDWRSALEKCKQLWRDYQDDRSAAGGENAVRWLGKAKSAVEQMVRYMELYPAVETRWRIEYGQTRAQLELLIEQLQEEIQALLRGRRAGGGGGYGGGGGIGRGGG